MFYFGEINNKILKQVQDDSKTILKSDLIKGAEAFFTTRDICICDKGVNNITPSSILPHPGKGNKRDLAKSPKPVSNVQIRLQI